MSWVIVSKSTGKAVAEFFDPRTVARINKDKYVAIPVQQYLANLNSAIAKAEGQ